MTPDVLGRPVEDVVKLLTDAGVEYVTELTRPTRNFFPVDDAKLYVVRAVNCSDDSCRLTLAAKQKKQ